MRMRSVRTNVRIARQKCTIWSACACCLRAENNNNNIPLRRRQARAGGKVITPPLSSIVRTLSTTHNIYLSYSVAAAAVAAAAAAVSLSTNNIHVIMRIIYARSIPPKRGATNAHARRKRDRAIR